MAKNLKLHIKNTQLAGAIDLQGLKAKLSKKKEPLPSSEPEQKPIKKTKKKEKELASPEVAQIDQEVSQPIHEVALESGETQMVESRPVEAYEIEREESVLAAEIQAPIEPVFSTLQTPEIVEAIQESPSIIEQKLAIQEEVPPSVKAQPVQEVPVKKAKEPQVNKPFLSALRVSPENLGPVIEKAVPEHQEKKRFDAKDAKRRPFSPDQKKPFREAPQKLWEPLKATEGSRYQTFSSQPRPPARPREEVSEGKEESRPFERRERRPGSFPPGERSAYGPRPGQGYQGQGHQGQGHHGPGHHGQGYQGQRPPYQGGRPPFPKREQPAAPVPLILGEDQTDELRRKAPTKEKEKEKVKEVPRFHKKNQEKSFDDTRLRRGIALEKEEEESLWRKKRTYKTKAESQEIETIRPKEISVRLPISVKDLAQHMKLKSSQLISKLFLSGVVVTLNDLLEDETTVQLLGEEFGCAVRIDTLEEQRLRITDKSIRDQIKETASENLRTRPPIVAFMGHVDHGKTSIIDKIRKSNRAQGEVGAITQHIGAFVCQTAHGPITILDTPGHEAFFQMRERGAHVTDIVVLVVAGDEGMKEQTIEALKQARESGATIVVAINKSDKPNYDEGMVFRQLAEQNLLPEAWGGQTVTVACSALTGDGIDALLEMLALQSEVLELKADPSARARGSIIETEMNKGLGAVATLLIQNGTLRLGDALVFETSFAKVKSMRDEWGKDVLEAGPSYAVRIHGLSSLPSAGEEFIVVQNEREAREIAEGRLEGKRQSGFQVKRRKTLESMMEQAQSVKKKELNVIIRADVQGSLEALCHALSNIRSDKINLNMIATGIGEISESDIQLASASKAIIIGYHTQVESHAENMIKAAGVQVRLHDIIYHAQDDVRDLMKNALDKIREEVYKGKAEVKTIFKSSHLGNIAGCLVIDGTITRNSHVRVRRGEEVVFDGTISSLKRFKEDVREVSKGTECGIVVNNWNEYLPGDIIESFDISYRAQEL